MPEDLTITLREYLDEKFGLLHADLSEIKTTIRGLTDGHNDLDKRVTRLEDQHLEFGKEAQRQLEFRQKLLIVLIPLCGSVVGYLLIQLIQALR